MRERKFMKFATFCLCICFLFITGCAHHFTLKDYEAKNYIKFSGTISMGYFNYLPYTSGEVAENQITNSSLAQFYLDQPVADYIKKATIRELQKTGIVISDDSPYVLSADILTLHFYNGLDELDWYYAVEYKIVDKATNEVCYSKKYIVPWIKRKFVYSTVIQDSIEELFLVGYDEFIRDENIKKFLTEKK